MLLTDYGRSRNKHLDFVESAPSESDKLDTFREQSNMSE